MTQLGAGVPYVGAARDGQTVQEAGPIRADVAESEPPLAVCEGIYTPPTGSSELQCRYGSLVEGRCFQNDYGSDLRCGYTAPCTHP